jgi:hypothetical protein
MTTSTAAAARPETTAEARKIVLKEIGAKWGKFSNKTFPRKRERRSRQPGPSHVGQAQHEVDALLKGRHI